MNQEKRRARATRKSKANRLERWNGCPQEPSKFKVQRSALNIFPTTRMTNAAPKFRMEETGRFLRTVVIKAGQRITQMIPLLRRVKVEEPS